MTSTAAAADGVYLEPNTTPLDDATKQALRASATALCWKRAADLPAHLRVTEAFMTNRSGFQLWYEAVFPAPDVPLRGVILFLHGINEHSARFFHVFEELAEMGFGVVAYDLRSHGKSHMDIAQLRGHIAAFQHVIDDTNDFIAFAKQEIYPQMGVSTSLPFIMMGYSMGSLVTLHTALSEQHHIDALVLAGLCVAIEKSPMMPNGLSNVTVSLESTARTVAAVNEDWVTRDELVAKDYGADPLAVSELLTGQTAKELGDWLDKLATTRAFDDPQSAFCRTPVLSIMGSNDRVCDVASAKKFHARIANADKQFVEIDGCYHVIFEDFERQRIMDVIQQWLHARFSPVSRQ